MGNWQNKKPEKVVVIGGGAAGLTATYELCNVDIPCVVLEKDRVVGGLARTGNYKGYLFDVGGHRFFTKVNRVETFWREILDDRDFMRRPRLSRIYYRGKFFHYPLRALNAVFGLGFWNSFLILLSYTEAQFFPQKTEENFEQWVCNRFGKRLYQIFFKTYTEKVWGIPCSEISADWAAQRINNLSLSTAVKNAILGKRTTAEGRVIKTLIGEFHYPRLGPGMMWERVAEKVGQNGAKVHLQTEVTKILWDSETVTALETRNGKQTRLIEASHFISTMPIRNLISKFEPSVPEEVRKAAQDLHYRDFLTVILIVDRPQLFPDNWIYVHEPNVRVGRIQNFKNWSPDMVHDPSKTCLGLEYFCFEGDDLWSRQEEELIELAKRELEEIGLARASEVQDGTTAKVPKAYPVYDSSYSESLAIVRDFLAGLDNLQCVGRNGMHKYNNQDHSMFTAMLAVDNIQGANHDIWNVNADPAYHEKASEADSETLRVLALTQPQVPVRRSA